MRITKKLNLFPWNLGIDRTSMPGAQDPRSLYLADNIIFENNGSRKKFYGVKDLNLTSQQIGIPQAICQFVATYNTAPKIEILRVINGRIEKTVDNEFVDITGDAEIHPTDIVSISRFSNTAIFFFENTKPYYYTIGADQVEELGIFDSHKLSPPRFGRVHDFRLVYAGRGDNPHILTLSAPDNPFSYTLASGGLSISVRDGDGDPKGINGISPTFRGELYVFKYSSIYKIYGSPYGYGVADFCDDIGTVAHDTICSINNDVYWVSNRGIHSLQSTDKFGSVEEATLTFPIYNYFQDNVNWELAGRMKASYDQQSNCYLLNYASKFSPYNDSLIGINTLTKQIFEVKNGDFTNLCQVIDYENKKRKTIYLSNLNGDIGVLRRGYLKWFDDGIPLKIWTGIIFPTQNPSHVVTFTKMKLIVKPTLIDSEIVISYEIDNYQQGTEQLNLIAGGYGAVIGDINSIIGGNEEESRILGPNKDVLIKTININGVGSCISVKIDHDPSEENLEQDIEIYGLIIEYEYNEDKDGDINI